MASPPIGWYQIILLGDNNFALPVGWYQIILLGDRGTRVLTTCPGCTREWAAGIRTQELVIASPAPYHYTTEPHIILSFNKIQNGDILVPGLPSLSLDERRRWHIHSFFLYSPSVVIGQLADDVNHTGSTTVYKQHKPVHFAHMIFTTDASASFPSVL